MATTYKTPGVYIQEPDSFPPSIVAVETAVPAFIGYTQTARSSSGKSLKLAPTRIESLAEFAQLFGGMYPELYYLSKVPEAPKPKDPANPTAEETAAAKKSDEDRKEASVKAVGGIRLGDSDYLLNEAGDSSFNLYNSLRLFYANGGGSCYIVSCGDYGGAVAKQPLLDGLDAVANVIGPTMLVVPDAVLLEADDYADVMNEALQQCLEKGDRIALIDVHGTDSIAPPKGPVSGQIRETIDTFRSKVGKVRESWRYGAAYFPFLETSVVQAAEVGLGNFDLATADRRTTLIDALKAEATRLNPPPPSAAAAAEAPGTETDKPATGGDKPAEEDGKPAGGTEVAVSTRAAQLTSVIDRLDPAKLPQEKAERDREPTLQQRSQMLAAAIPAVKQLFAQMAAAQNMLPPSGAMAGIYAMNDAVGGVWNAPANVGIVGLIQPNVPVTENDQEDLNVPAEGKAVNAIRTFPGRGSLVWGARTLDSNSNDWRYIQVRRTMIFIEQSVKTALNAFVFAPNTAQTWVTVASMIESFLHGVWAAGGLMGSSAGEAFNVQVGLGSTMTPTDVLEGRMIVQITLQMVRPAEFIVLTFRQQMLGTA